MKSFGKLLYIILLTLMGNNAYSQSPITIWTKTYGLNTADDRGYSVIETKDSGFAVAGYTASFGAGGYDVWFLRIDINGDTLWTKTYGGIGDDYGYSLKQTEDGGFVIGGATSSFGNGGLDYYLIKTNSLGDTLWTKTFGGINDDIGWALAESEDGGYIIAGEKDVFPADADIWVIKSDSLGQMVWQKMYGTETEEERAFSINKTSDGGYIVAGAKGCNGYASCDGWLLKLNSNGDSLWTRSSFDGEETDWFNSVKQTPEGGYLVVGKTNSIGIGFYPGNIWLIKTDSIGNQIWMKTFDYDGDHDAGYDAQTTIDGALILAGQGWLFDAWGLVWVIRTNSSGDTLWTKTFNNFSENASGVSCSGFGFSVLQSSITGDYIVAGVVAQDEPGGLCQDQLFLAKIASDIIPVELTSFTANVEANNVSLNWKTATETNNSGFEIERKQVGSPQSSVGNQDWNVVGFVPGFGTTTEPKSYSFIDENLSAGTYQYRLKQIDFDGSFEYSNTVEVEISAPTVFSLAQNYPNPFNPITKIKYTIPVSPNPSQGGASGNLLVTLKVFDVLGNEVATLVNEQKEPGNYQIDFNASELSSGIYYYTMTAGNFTSTKKMILMK